VPVAVLCSLPGVRFSTACGHNAFLWFILTIPLGFLLAAILTIRRYSKPQSRSLGDDFAIRLPMKAIESYPASVDADLARIRLEAAGIDAAVVGIGVGMEGGSAGVRLLVPEDRVEAALKVLGEG
jgi:hypothetical protein